MHTCPVTHPMDSLRTHTPPKLGVTHLRNIQGLFAALVSQRWGIAVLDIRGKRYLGFPPKMATEPLAESAHHRPFRCHVPDLTDPFRCPALQYIDECIWQELPNRIALAERKRRPSERPKHSFGPGEKPKRIRFLIRIVRRYVFKPQQRRSGRSPQDHDGLHHPR